MIPSRNSSSLEALSMISSSVNSQSGLKSSTSPIVMNVSYYGSWINFDNLILKTDRLYSSIYQPRQKLCNMCYFENQSLLNSHPCDAGICDHCLFRYLRVVISGDVIKKYSVNTNNNSNISQIFSIPCYCGYCSYSIPESTILRVLASDRSLLRKYYRYQSNLLVKYSENYCWCPIPGCETLLIKSSTVKLLTCHKCNYKFCSDCRQEYLTNEHETVNCHEIMNQELLLYRKSSSNPCKRCPNCRVNIEKNDGCDHMTCTHCGYEFCWFCKREYFLCCHTNPFRCAARGILKHRIWGHHPTSRLTKKIIGLPILTGVSIGVGAAVVGIGIGVGAVGLVCAPIYYGGRYVVDEYL